MKRVVAVLLAALLMTEAFGLGGASLAGQSQAASGTPARRPKVVKRLAEIPPGAVVKIELENGRKLNAYLEAVTPDTITVTVLVKGATVLDKEVIPIGDIKKIDEARGHTARNILLGVGIGVTVLVGLAIGTCGAVASRPTTATADAPPPQTAR